jgi:chromosome partitioning protein
VLTDRLPLEQVLTPTDLEFLQIVPAHPDLTGAEIELVEVTDRHARLAQALKASRRRFDYILIDCPPSLGLLTLNALVAASSVLVPLQCEYYALEGLSQLLATVHLVRDHLNPRLAVNGIVLTMYDARTNLAAEVAAEARQHLDGAVYDTIVPRSVRLAEAPSHGRPIAQYAPDSRGATAYRALADELRARLAVATTGGVA